MNQLLKNHKRLEQEHYDALALQWQRQSSQEKWQKDVHMLQHDLYTSYEYLDSLLKIHSPEKIVLDYGCGTGIHSISPILYGAKQVIGIDISEESLTIANERVRRARVEEKTSFQIMDCEKMKFPDNTFDIILDGGAFSSLNLEYALRELARVLKPEGTVIGIETLGHNHFVNLKRRLNRLRGTRTSWATSHILKIDDFERVKRHFTHVETHFFHLTVLFAMPLKNFPGMRWVITALNRLDSYLFSAFPFLKKYAFKVVFIFRNPRQSP